MGTEAFAEAAQLLAPGWQVEAIEDVEFLAPFKWYRDERAASRSGCAFIPTAAASLPTAGSRDAETSRPARAGDDPLHRTRHPRPDTNRPRRGAAAATAGTRVTADAIYRVYFHGPAYQVLAGVRRNDETAVGELADDLPREPRRR